MGLGKKTNQTQLNIILIHLPIQDSLTIHWKPSTESCGRRSCARRDTGAHQCTLASVAQDRSIGRDRRRIHTRRTIVDRRTTRKSENVRDPSRAAPSPIHDQDPVRGIDQCGEDQKAVPIAHGESEMKTTSSTRSIIQLKHFQLSSQGKCSKQRSARRATSKSSSVITKFISIKHLISFFCFS